MIYFKVWWVTCWSDNIVDSFQIVNIRYNHLTLKLNNNNNKGIRDAGSTADFRILFENFETLEIFDFFETFKFLNFLIYL